MKRVIAVLVSLCFLSGCAFNKQVTISSTPPGATVKHLGETVGVTPITTELKCTTFNHKKRTVELSLEGYRTQSTELQYKASGRNITVSILFFWPGLFVNMKCPRPNYTLDLAKESASLAGQATLTISELVSDSEIYVGTRRIVPGETMILPPGRQELSARRGDALVPAGEIRLEPDTDYLIGLGERSSRD